jgi:hypothetical protein
VPAMPTPSADRYMPGTLRAVLRRRSRFPRASSAGCRSPASLNEASHHHEAEEHHGPCTGFGHWSGGRSRWHRRHRRHRGSRWSVDGWQNYPSTAAGQRDEPRKSPRRSAGNRGCGGKDRGRSNRIEERCGCHRRNHDGRRCRRCEDAGQARRRWSTDPCQRPLMRRGLALRLQRGELATRALAWGSRGHHGRNAVEPGDAVSGGVTDCVLHVGARPSRNRNSAGESEKDCADGHSRILGERCRFGRGVHRANTEKERSTRCSCAGPGSGAFKAIQAKRKPNILAPVQFVTFTLTLYE